VVANNLDNNSILVGKLPYAWAFILKSALQSNEKLVLIPSCLFRRLYRKFDQYIELPLRCYIADTMSRIKGKKPR